MSNKNFVSMVSKLDQMFVGRALESRGLVLALLAGEHALLLGPPGTGKSLLIRVLTQMVGAKTFSWLMNPFTTPEDVLGPVSFSGLQQDRYQRVFTDKLPEAEIAFLDEIWKATVIHNTLLTILNEREVHDGGGAHKIPLHSMFCASNELPQSGQGLEAIYDRVLLRYMVRELTASEMVHVMLHPVPETVAQVVTMADVKAAQSEVRQVQMPEAAVELLGAVRVALEAEGITASTRRYIQSVKLLRGAAWLDGDIAVSGDHFGVLADVFWRRPEERAKVVEVVNKTAAPTRLLVQEILDALTAEKVNVSTQKTAPKAQYMAAVSDVLDHVRDARKRMVDFGSTKAAVKAGLVELQAMETEITQELLAATTGRPVVKAHTARGGAMGSAAQVATKAPF